MRKEPTKGKGARRPLQFGKYEVVCRIGSGGMGSVYKALDRDLGRVVALKVLPATMANKPDMIERFRREARSAAKLRHENIVILYDFGEQQGTFYLVMEFVEGTDLQEYIDRKRVLDVDEAVNILRQALQALDHAYQEGIVHRDIKPSNFMLTRRGEQLLVKLTDMGLARQEDDPESSPLTMPTPKRKGVDPNRLTQAGTTVGTVDYMSPEQARNSAMADVRSDLYSLGCTLYHMLTGQPPFNTGSSTERLVKHIEQQAKDVRSLNPRVPVELAELLQRMMAKKPEDRFQTPAAVLAALEEVMTLPAAFDFEQRDVLAELARGKTESPALDDDRPREHGPRQRRGSAANRPSSTVKRARTKSNPTMSGGSRTRPASKAKGTAASGSRQWMIVVGVGAAAVIATIIVLATTSGGRSRHESTEPKEPPRAVRLPETAPARPPEPPPVQATPPRVINWPALYKPATPVDAVALRKQMEAPWAAEAAASPDVPALVVSRSYTGGDGEGHYGTLSAAAAAKAKGGTTVYELQDPGPFFEPSVTWSDRNIVLRGAPGQRTLLVWDVNLARERKASFLCVARGNLTLQDLDVVLRWPEAEAADPVALLQVFEGDLTARNCTFSFAGTYKGGLALAQLDGSRAGCRCRLQRCFARGGQLTALALNAPGVDASIEDSLVAGGERPLIQVLGRKQPTTTVRTSHSTLVGGSSFLSIRPASAADTTPVVVWEGWDSLLARSRETAGGNLIEFLEKAESAGLAWHGVNCIYAGWKTLLQDRDPIPATSWERWRQRVQDEDSDRAASDAWPLAVRHDTAELAPTEYEIAPETPVGFAATPEAGLASRPLGCPLATLPPGRANWLTNLYQRYPIPTASLAASASEGITVDSHTVADLGAYVQQYEPQLRQGNKIVLHLTGSGDWYTSPIKLKGTSLVLRFDAPDRTDPMPLALVGRSGSPGEPQALISIEGGDLELESANIRMPGPRGLPPHLIQVSGGNLLIRDSRLSAGLTQTPANFRSLIAWSGSNEEALDRSRTCVIVDSALLSGYDGLEVAGGGARIHLEQSLILAFNDALCFPLQGARSRLNVRLTLDHVTVAARKALFNVSDVPQLGNVQEPMLVQPTACAFLVPREPGKLAPHATLLQAEGNALGRGLVLWQGEGNFYDRTLHAYVRAAPASQPEAQQDPPLWQHLWGTLPEQTRYVAGPGVIFAAPDPKLERFSLLGLGLPRPVPGVDLNRPVFLRPLRTPI